MVVSFSIIFTYSFVFEEKNLKLLLNYLTLLTHII